MSSFLMLPEQQKLAELAGIAHSPRSGIIRASGDSVITIHMGPGQVPTIARILRSEWPSIAALNHSEGQEFHVRLRQHRTSGVCIVYCSISWDDRHPRCSPDGRRLPRPDSIFSEVVQRGRLCRNQSQFEAAVSDIRRELGISGKLLQ